MSKQTKKQVTVKDLFQGKDLQGKLDITAEIMNYLREEEIIRNPSKINNLTMGQVIIDPLTNKFKSNKLTR
jgi:hypothetical protein